MVWVTRNLLLHPSLVQSAAASRQKHACCLIMVVYWSASSLKWSTHLRCNLSYRTVLSACNTTTKSNHLHAYTRKRFMTRHYLATPECMPQWIRQLSLWVRT
jgi:hypothetical protein